MNEPYVALPVPVSLYETQLFLAPDAPLDAPLTREELPPEHGPDCICRTPEWEEGLLDPWTP